MESISSVATWNRNGPKVLSEAPSMPMSNLYERLRGTLPPFPGINPQSSSNDAVAISPEAQAAADLLRPAN